MKRQIVGRLARNPRRIAPVLAKGFELVGRAHHEAQPVVFRVEELIDSLSERLQMRSPKPHMVRNESPHRIFGPRHTQDLINPCLPIGDDARVAPLVVLK